METFAIETAPGRKRRSTAAKVDAQPRVLKVKTSISLDVETHRRLGIHALMRGVDPCDVVAELVEAHLRDYVVQYRGAKRVENPADGATLAVEDMTAGESVPPSPAPTEGESAGAGGESVEPTEKPGRKPRGRSAA